MEHWHGAAVDLNSTHHRLLYTWIGHEIFGTAIRVVIAVDDGCEMYLSRAENMKL